MKLEPYVKPQVLQSKTTLPVIILYIIMFFFCVLLIIESVLLINCQQDIRNLNHYLDKDLKPRLYKIDKVFNQAERIQHHIQSRYRKNKRLAADIAYAIVWAGRVQEIEPELITGVIEAESSFHPGVISRAGCRGLMQLSPSKLADWQNIWMNIWVGTRYLRAQVLRFGRVDVALASYNCGPNHPRKMFVSRGYINRVRWYQRRLEGLRDDGRI